MTITRRPLVPRRTRWLLLIAIAVALGTWQYGYRQPAPPPAAPKDTVVVSVPRGDLARPPAPPAEGDSYDLGADEARGGHTLARHVGRSDAQLRERLDRERQVSAASTYTDRATAQRTVARALAAGQARLDSWLGRQGRRPNLALDYRGREGEVLGRSLRRGQQRAVDCIDAVVVLRWTRGREYYVLTSYPEARR